MTPLALATELGVCRNTVGRWITLGMPHTRRRHRITIDRAAALEWVERLGMTRWGVKGKATMGKHRRTA